MKKIDIDSQRVREISHWRKGARDGSLYRKGERDVSLFSKGACVVPLLNEGGRDLSILGVEEYMKIYS